MTSGSGGPGSNEAAERLRAMDPDGSRTYLLDKALAAERKVTVERIEALDRFSDDSGIEYVEVDAIRAAILDEAAGLRVPEAEGRTR